MKRGSCPKCNQLHVHRQPRGRLAPEVGSSIPGRVIYLCVFCGYLECYLLDREQLSAMARQWPHVKKRADE